MNYLTLALKISREQQYRTWLAVKRQEEEQLAVQFRGRLMDLYRPITDGIGHYWRNGKWNPLPI